MPIAGLILAAGKGTRMKSDLPKGLHPVCGVPMVELVGRAMRGAGVQRPILVIGHGGEDIQSALGEAYQYAWQREQLGTGHAALMAADLLKGHKGLVVIAPGDTPLISEETLLQLIAHHQEQGVACTVASARVTDPTGYGRIVRDVEGNVERIVEHKDASADEQLIHEVNASIYVFDNEHLLELLPTLKNNNAQGEYYLTDAVEAFAQHGKASAFVVDDPEILMGVNDRWQLAQADKALRMRTLKRHALNGVSIVDPDTTYIGPDVEIGPDSTIDPSTVITGVTKIGSNCRLGPFTTIKNATIGDGCYVYLSFVNQAVLEEGVKVGPFAHIRPDSVLKDEVKIGNFVEIKKAVLEEGVKVSHLSYIGDAKVGEDTNIGAGTITCNYDGFSKSQTVIGENVFIGSNNTLVAPLNIGDGAMTAAGSVITQDVPEGALGIGRSRTEVKEQWAAQWRKRKSKQE